MVGLAEATRALRLQRGWTLEEAAERADVAVRHWQMLESGSSNPTAATLLRVARGFGVPVYALFPSGEGVAPERPMPAAERETVSSDEAVAAAVRWQRVQRDWSQAELAARAGLSQGAVQSVEAATKSPTLRTLDAIASSLDVTSRDLLEPLMTDPRSRTLAKRT